MNLKYKNKNEYVQKIQTFYSQDSSLVSGPLIGKNLMRILKKINPKNKRILDVGCGYGKLIQQTKKEYPDNEFIGVDLNSNDVSIAKSNLKFGNFFVMELESLNFKPASFDLIFCADTLEHAYNSEKAIEELSRVLKRNGLLILSVPNYFNITGLFKLFFEKLGFYERNTFNGFRISPVEHENFLTYFKLKKLLKKSEFTISYLEGIELLGGIIPFLGLYYTWYLIGKKFRKKSLLRFVLFRLGDISKVLYNFFDLLSRYIVPFKYFALHNFYVCKKIYREC